ncbi:MAG: hypothetical protein K8U03_13640 [Planctomycetia bacterium]|nr:hypothetical protein [Planctomycetia bacterium]
MRLLLSITVVGALVSVGGCAALHKQERPILSNPIAIPATRCDLVWDQIVDVVDNYFDIQTEQRVREAGTILTVGRIDTAPKTGATYFEPWRGDAADSYERLHGTLQTLRRRAMVQVIPAPDVFQIEVVVYKELEDLARPDQSTAGSATFRTDSSFIRVEDPVGVQPTTIGWIPLGRDRAMEQKILHEIMDRLGPPGGFGPYPGGGPGPIMVPEGMEFESNIGPAETIPPGAASPAILPSETLPPGTQLQ